MNAFINIILKCNVFLIPNKFFKLCFYISDYFFKLGELLLVQKETIHPKHFITKYSNFFTDNINDKQVVIDLGCGIGYTSKKIAEKAKYVVGLDFDSLKILKAKKLHSSPNIEFITENIYNYAPDKQFDVAILSNVLEHLEFRPAVLKKIRSYAKHLLIRVPNIERDWYTVFKKNTGMEYRSDPTHTIEHDFSTLQKEILAGGWKIIENQFRWGEIWCVCVPSSQK